MPNVHLAALVLSTYLGTELSPPTAEPSWAALAYPSILLRVSSMVFSLTMDSASSLQAGMGWEISARLISQYWKTKQKIGDGDFYSPSGAFHKFSSLVGDDLIGRLRDTRGQSADRGISSSRLASAKF